MAETTLLIRPEAPGERRYVDSRWLKNFLASHDAGPLVKDLAWRDYDEHIARLRARASWRCAVAACAGVADQLIGFIAWEPVGHHRHPAVVRHPDNPQWTTTELRACAHPALLYVYVDQAFRNDGVARALLAHAGIDPKKPFCFQFRTLDMRARVTGAGTTPGPRPWRGGKFDPRTYRDLPAAK